IFMKTSSTFLCFRRKAHCRELWKSSTLGFLLMSKRLMSVLSGTNSFIIHGLRARWGLFIFLFLSLAFTSACGRSSKKGKNTAVPDRYFVLGDPMVMLEGTLADKDSFFTTATLEDFSDYVLAGFTVFAPKVDLTT